MAYFYALQKKKLDSKLSIVLQDFSLIDLTGPVSQSIFNSVKDLKYQEYLI